MNSGSLVATSNSLYDGSRGRSILLTRSRQFLDVLFLPYSSTDKSTVSSLIDVECRIIEVERECNSRREKKRSLPEREEAGDWLARGLAGCLLAEAEGCPRLQQLYSMYCDTAIPNWGTSTSALRSAEHSLLRTSKQ